MDFEALENRTLLATNITDSQLISLEQGLSGLAGWGQSLAQYGPLAQEIPFINEPIGKALSITKALQDTLVTPAQAYLGLHSIPGPKVDPNNPPTWEGLASSLGLVPGLQQVTTDFTSGLAIRINDLHYQSTTATPIDLGANTAGLKVDASANVNLTADLELGFTFGFDPTPGLAPSEAFFVRPNAPGATGIALAAGVSMTSAAANFDLSVGVLAAKVQNGTANLSARATANVVDPNGDGKITLAEIQGTPLSSLVPTVTVGPLTNSLNVTLPVHAELRPGVAGTYAADGTVSITDDNLFDSTLPTVAFSAPDALKNFKNLGPRDLIALLEQLGSSLQGISKGLDAPGDIPFVGGAVQGVVDFTKVLPDLTRPFFDAVLTGSAQYTASQPAPATGLLDKDAHFALILTHVDTSVTPPQTASTRVDLIVPAGSYGSVAGLVAAIQSKIAGGGLNGKVVAEADPADPTRIRFRAVNSTDRLTLRFAASDPGMSQIGFEATLTDAVFKFDTIQEFIAQLADALPLLDQNGIDVKFDPATNALTFNVKYVDELKGDTTLDFTRDIKIGPAALSLTGKVDASVDAMVTLDLGLGIDLSPVGHGFTISRSTPLSTLNGGAGVQLASAGTDLRITRRDGTSFEVSLAGSTTLGDVLDRINAASGGNVTADINNATVVDPASGLILAEAHTVMTLVDSSTPALNADGTPKFHLTIARANNSLAGNGLGIVGSDLDGDGVVVGTSLSGDSLLQHLFVKDGSSVSASVTFATNNINLAAGLGIVELAVVGGTANFTIGTGLTLHDPTPGDGGIHVGEFLASSPGPDGVPNTPDDVPLVLVLTTPSASGGLTLPVTIEGGDALGISLPASASIQATFSAPPLSVQYTATGFDDLLASFSTFSTADVLKIAVQVISLLQSSNLKAFNDPLPLVQVSVNQILKFTDPLLDAIKAVKDQITGGVKSLKSSLLDAVDAIRHQIDPNATNLLASLSEGQLQRLVDAVDALADAVRALPDTIPDALSFQMPSALVGAIAGVKQALEVIDNAPPADAAAHAALVQLESGFKQVTSAVPSVQRLAEYLLNALGLPAPDFSSAGALTTSVLADVNAAITDLHAAGLTDAQLAPLVGARDALQGALIHSDLLKLADSFGKLGDAITGLKPSLTQGQLDTLNGILTHFTNVFPDRLALSFDSNRQLKAEFDLSILQVTKTVDLNFSLSDATLGGAVPVSLQSGGKLDVMLAGTLHVGIGVDLGASPSDGLIYLLPGTPVELEARVGPHDPSGLNASVNIGGVSAIQLVNGTLTLAAPNGTDPASLKVVLTDPDSNGKISLAELAGAVSFAGSGAFHMDVDVEIAGTDAGHLKADLNDLADFSNVTFALPPNFVDAITGGLLDPLTLFENVPAFLDMLHSGLNSQILTKLPLVGHTLSTTGDVIGELNDEFVKPLVEKLKAGLGNVPDTVKTALQKLIFDTLGPGLDPSDPDYSTYNVLSGPGLNILEKTGSTTLATNPGDVDVSVNVAAGKNLLNDPDAQIVVHLHIGGHEGLTSDFNLGLDALGLVGVQGHGGVSIGVDYDVEVGFEIDKKQGFSLLLNDAGPGTPDILDPGSLPVNSPDPEIEFKIGVGLAAGTTLEANLFFLNVAATDPNGTTGFHGETAIDLATADPGNKLPLAEIPSAIDLHPSLTVDAKADLLLTATINKDPDFPSITAELLVDWKFSLTDATTAAPTVALNDVTLDLGKFISKTLKPVLDAVDQFLGPIRPILDTLNTDVPVISQLLQIIGQDPITFLDAIGLYGEGAGDLTRFIHVLTQIEDFAHAVAALPGDVKIDFGNFDFGSQDLRQGGPISVPDQSQDLGSFLDTHFAAGTPDSDKAATKTFLATMSSTGDDGLGKFDFPLLTHPSNVFKLLFGQDANLITWQLPKFDAKFEYNQIFGPIIPPFPIFATIGGQFEVFAQFSLGLDTRGLKTGHFFDGFFFGDHRDVSDGPEIPEIGMSAAITAGAEVNIAFAEAGVRGGIGIDVTADWHDPDNDGKVYFDELEENLSRGLDCLFDLAGRIHAFLQAFLKIEIPLGFTSITIVDENITIVDVTLLDFSHTCPPLPPPVPATQVGDTLYLNVGPRAALRQPGAKDVDETVTIRGEGDFNHDGTLSQTVDANGDGKISADELGEDLNNDGVVGDDVVAVTGFGVTQIFTGVHHIVGDGGTGKDSITLDPSVKATAALTGGDGDDVLQGGSGNDTISGGEGNDQVSGGAGDDSLSGDGGNDVIFGNAGADAIAGGGGDDILYGGDNDNKDQGDLADTITGDDGNDKIYGNLGDDVLSGGAGSDTVHGGKGNDRIAGGGDDDFLFGDDGNDVMEGDAGNDQLAGGDGNDKMIGGSSTAGPGDSDGNDVLLGQGGDDIMIGDNGIIDGVTLTGGSGSDTMIGGDGADVMYGQGGDDVMLGDNGTVDPGTNEVHLDPGGTPGKDYMEGDAGSDAMFGGAGNDAMIGGASAVVAPDAGDSLFGGDGDDVMLGDNGTIDPATGEAHTNDAGGGAGDTMYGGAGNDVLFGGAGADTLIGDGLADSGDDIIVGDQGYRTTTLIAAAHSTVPASSGDDTMVGSAGRDTMLGGDGNDQIAGDADADVLVGDNGRVTLAIVGGDPVVTRIETTDFANGGADTITGSGGADSILGGSGADLLTGGGDGGADVLLGDNGVVVRNDGTTQANDIFSNDTAGAADQISGGPGDDTVLGGAGADVLLGGTGNDVILGDHGYITRDASDVVQRIETTFEGNGGDDLIDGDAGSDTVLGGIGNDRIIGGGDGGADVLLGDNGVVVRNDGSSDANDIFSRSPSWAGDDTVTGGPGNDSIMGGSGNDTIGGDEGDDVILGDNGRITRNASDAVEQIATTFPDQGGVDLIRGDDGRDTILGGAAGDNLAGNAGDDVILGDNGRLDDNAADALSTLVLITTTDPTKGGADVITGDDGNDTIFGGTADDDISGGNQADLIFGDHGKVDLTLPGNRNFTSIDTGQADGGGADLIHGNDGNDTVLGGQAGDLIYGEDGDDDLIGGHNVSGADGNDTIDGGAGDDVLTGDNAVVIRRTDAVSPLDRTLAGTALYNPDGSPAVTAASQLNPSGAVGRDITLLDHSVTAPAYAHGDDSMAGGAGNDTMFGELGDDVIQGDSTVGTVVAIGVPSVPASTDGDDYVEGNGGNDLIFGNLGQDDLIGGSSNLFGLSLPSQRPDGSDTIFGGAGTLLARNDPGDATANGHADDSDMILGDNGNIYRIVGIYGMATSPPAFQGFNYDNYGSHKIVVRATSPLDYTPGGPDYSPAATNDIGAGDTIHGEAGDDFIYGQKGDDVIFGEGQDDDIIGGYGNDWISGGTGSDGILGDDGRIFTSRNGLAEPLNGVTVIAGADLNKVVTTPGTVQMATINVSGALKKTVDLTPFSVDPAWDGTTDEFGGAPKNAHNSDDILYGGLGNDFLHGGSGDDAMMGGEAPVESYAQSYVGGTLVGLVRSDYGHPFNPGNVLAYNPVDPNSKHPNLAGRTGEFALYDEFDPLRKVLLNNDGTLNKTNTGKEFLLNPTTTDGPLDTNWDAPGVQRNTDGDDVIFGDLGNDWIVGGTGRDDMFGGWGNDLLNADDNLTTDGGLNDVPETAASYEDRAYGGAGKDALIANTGGDRLIDWVGEFNSYLVPFSPFGMATVSRTLQPQLAEFLYALSQSDGVDMTRAADTGSDPARHGEPDGELGLIRQKDAAWHDQTGAPTDPQPGNTPGTKRDVLRGALFTAGQASGLFPDSGTWSLIGGVLQGTSGGGDAVNLFDLDVWLPSYYEVVSNIKLSGNSQTNGYIIFDYQSKTDFKYAGIDASASVLRIGERTATGWVDTAVVKVKLNGANFNPTLAVNGSTAVLTVGQDTLRYTFNRPLNDGMVGVGVFSGAGSFSSFTVQTIPRVFTYQVTEDFSDGLADKFAVQTGTWATTSGTAGRYTGTPGATDPAISVRPLAVAPLSYVEYSATVAAKTGGTSAGLMFAYTDSNNFLYAAVVAASNQVVLGHRSGGRWSTDAVVTRTIAAGADYTLLVALDKQTVNVVLNGQTALSFTYNILTLGGQIGLLARNGAASFDNLVIRGDDVAFTGGGPPLMAASAPSPALPPPAPLRGDQLEPIIAAAIQRWSASPGSGVNAALLDAVPFEIADLPGRMLGQTIAGTIVIDSTAAGFGWSVDASPVAGSMDLLSVVMHELGHALGLEDLDAEANPDALMADSLAPGTRLLPSVQPYQTGSAVPRGPATLGLTLPAAPSLAPSRRRLALSPIVAGRPGLLTTEPTGVPVVTADNTGTRLGRQSGGASVNLPPTALLDLALPDIYRTQDPVADPVPPITWILARGRRNRGN